MSSTVRCVEDLVWLINSSSCLEKDLVGKREEDTLDFFGRRNSWELDQEELLNGGVDGWQLLPLVEQEESWLTSQDYGTSLMQSGAGTQPAQPSAPLVASSQYGASLVQQELMRGQLEQGVYNEDAQSHDQHTSCSWLDTVMLEELSVLANNHVSGDELFVKDEQQYVVHMNDEESSFDADTSCVTIPSTVELEDLFDMIDGPVVEDQIYQESIPFIDSVDTATEWSSSTQCNVADTWQEQEIMSTSCENSDDSFSESDMSDNEEFVPSMKSIKSKRKKPVKRCSVRREEYARLTLSQRRERKKEQNKNAATKYREKKRFEEMEKESLCDVLERRNGELKKEVAEKEREVKLLRKLVINIFRPAESKKIKATKK